MVVVQRKKSIWSLPSNIPWFQNIIPFLHESQERREWILGPWEGPPSEGKNIYFWGTIHDYKHLSLKQPAAAGGNIINN